MSATNGDDLRRHRDWLLSFVPLEEPLHLLDAGCGEAADLLALAARCSHTQTRLLGVDASTESVAKARQLAATDRRLEIRQLHLDASLPFDDATFDVVYTRNLLECLAEPRAFVAETARILRPGGNVVAAHWDWDSQLFDGADKALIRRLVHGFADFQQDWMEHADGWLGRRLWGLFASSGQFTGGVHARVLTNTSFTPGCYGYARAHDFALLVEHGLTVEPDYQRFLAEQEALAARGAYFYGITAFAYVGQRVS